MKYQVRKSIVIDADPNTVRPYVADLRQWAAWSPWSIIEPDHKSSFAGTHGEVGSSMSWDGDVIGSGKMTLVSVVNEEYEHKLEFFAPWKSQAKATVALQAKGASTQVTWTMDGTMPFYLFFMVGMMKAWIGMDYDRGLRMLKELAENGQIDAQTSDLGVVDFEGFAYVGLANTSLVQDMPSDMQADFDRLMRDIAAASCDPKHHLAIYTNVKMSKQRFSYISAVSDESASGLALSDDYVRGRIPSQKMLEIRHRGSYRFLGNAWSMGHMVARAKKMKTNGKPFEYYHNSPNEVAENELLTSVYFPVKG